MIVKLFLVLILVTLLFLSGCDASVSNDNDATTDDDDDDTGNDDDDDDTADDDDDDDDDDTVDDDDDDDDDTADDDDDTGDDDDDDDDDDDIVDLPPVFIPPSPISFDEDTVDATVDLNTLFTDDHGIASYAVVSVDHGTAQVLSGHILEVTSDADYSGDLDVVVRARDTAFQSTLGTVPYAVQPVNDPPVWLPSTPTSLEDPAESFSLDLTPHVDDVDSASLTITEDSPYVTMNGFTAEFDYTGQGWNFEEDVTFTLHDEEYSVDHALHVHAFALDTAVVSGHVKYPEGWGVPDHTVTFTDTSTSEAYAVDVDGGGAYSIELPLGTYDAEAHENADRDDYHGRRYEDVAIAGDLTFDLYVWDSVADCGYLSQARVPYFGPLGDYPVPVYLHNPTPTQEAAIVANLDDINAVVASVASNPTYEIVVYERTMVPIDPTQDHGFKVEFGSGYFNTKYYIGFQVWGALLHLNSAVTNIEHSTQNELLNGLSMSDVSIPGECLGPGFGTIGPNESRIIHLGIHEGYETARDGHLDDSPPGEDVYGYVKHPEGWGAPGHEITFTHTTTGAVIRKFAEADAYYELTVPVGTYDVEVHEAPGYIDNYHGRRYEDVVVTAGGLQLHLYVWPSSVDLTYLGQSNVPRFGPLSDYPVSVYLDNPTPTQGAATLANMEDINEVVAAVASNPTYEIVVFEQTMTPIDPTQDHGFKVQYGSGYFNSINWVGTQAWGALIQLNSGVIGVEHSTQQEFVNALGMNDTGIPGECLGPGLGTIGPIESSIIHYAIHEGGTVYAMVGHLDD